MKPLLLKLCARDARPTRHVLVLLDSGASSFLPKNWQDFWAIIRTGIPCRCFWRGSADGFSDQARQAATLVLSLGKMTLAHELARVVLLEQLYRGVHYSKRSPLSPGTLTTIRNSGVYLRDVPSLRQRA